MKKIYLLVICTLLLVGCTNSDNESSNINVIMQLESDYSIAKNNIEELNNGSDVNFYYKEENVGKNEVVLYLYYSSTCPHCHAEINWLNSIKDKYPYLKIVKKEASENMDEYEKIIDKMEINDYHVPLTIIGGSYYIGYTESKISYFDSMIKYYSTFENCDMVDTILNNKNIDNCKQINKK